MEEELSIKVNIADRFYPLIVKGSEEERVRKAARLVNDKLKDLQQQFAVKDKQDMLSMISLELATAILRHKEETETGQQLADQEIQQIQTLLQAVKL